MQRLPCLALLLVAVGCGGKARPASSSGTGASSAVPIPDGPPCPDASSVAIAVVHQPSAGAPGGWHLPLANRASTETTARYQVLDAAAAAAAAIPAPPAKLWLMTGGTLCEATPGPWYSDVVIDGPANEVLGVQLSTKCPVPGSEQPQQALALAAEVAPAGCVAISPRPVAGRVGEEQGGRWSLLPQSTPMPPAVEAALPKKDCAAPCETLWTVAQVDFAGKPIAWDVAMEWLHVDPAQPDACQWASEGDGGVLVASPAGAVRVADDHAVSPLHLGAVLADRAGAKVLVLEHIGEYSTFDLGAAGAKLARHLRWVVPNEELYAGDRKLGPYCGP